jgi:hypothetical protein
VVSKDRYQRNARRGVRAVGADGARPNGGLNNRQLIFFINAEVWENVDAYFEWFPLGAYAFNQPGGNNSGEAYIVFKNLIRAEGQNRLSAKVGRFDLPFGEEYLQQNWIDNPLISRSAAWPWGWDNGLELYGTYRSVGWIFSLTDGKFGSNMDSDNDESFNPTYTGKIYSDLTEWLHASLSFISSGRHARSALWFGEDNFVTPGAGTGNGTTGAAKYVAFEGALKSHFHGFEMLVNYGGLQITDVNDHNFDRQIWYYMVQPVYWVADRWYLAARYSDIESEMGGYAGLGGQWHDGNYTTNNPNGARTSFPVANVRSSALAALAVGFRPNPNVLAVAEYTQPRFAYTDQDDPHNWGRRFWGLKFVTKF